MNEALELNNLTKDLKLDVEVNRSERVFTNTLQSVVSKGADYVIKGMPINDHIKDIIIDVKKSLDTKDFKQILKTVVSSTIDEGLEILNMPKNVIKDITKIKDISLKGGLREGICAAIDIVTDKYLKNNMYVSFIKDFITKTKNFIFSRSFGKKISDGINNIVEKADKFKDKCKQWYSYYNDLDFDNMNSLAKVLNREKSKVANDADCVKENSIIQNITKLVNNKKDKLSPIQLQICNSL